MIDLPTAFEMDLKQDRVSEMMQCGTIQVEVGINILPPERHGQKAEAYIRTS
jgi:hypothetical protein